MYNLIKKKVFLGWLNIRSDFPFWQLENFSWILIPPLIHRWPGGAGPQLPWVESFDRTGIVNYKSLVSTLFLFCKAIHPWPHGIVHKNAHHYKKKSVSKIKNYKPCEKQKKNSFPIGAKKNCGPKSRSKKFDDLDYFSRAIFTFVS